MTSTGPRWNQSLRVILSNIGANKLLLLCIMEALLILEPFRHFIYITAHSPTLPSLCLRYSSFSNPSVASPTSQLVLQPFFRFSYVKCSSLTSPGEPPMWCVTGWLAGGEAGCAPFVPPLDSEPKRTSSRAEWVWI